MVDFDISGWIPHWAPAPDEMDLQRANLLDCLGHRIVDSWLVWNLELDEWFADLPVVLRLDDGRQLEASWQKFDDLSITWNTIDVAIAPIAWVTWPLEWRSQAHAALRAGLRMASGWRPTAQGCTSSTLSMRPDSPTSPTKSALRAE